MENLKIEGHIWLETSTGLKIGKGRALLLEQIEKTGSIAEAARNTDIPYRKAWGMIQEMNNCTSSPLVIKSLGGKGGGGSVLTPKGKSVLQAFKRADLNFVQFKKSSL